MFQFSNHFIVAGDGIPGVCDVTGHVHRLKGSVKDIRIFMEQFIKLSVLYHDNRVGIMFFDLQPLIVLGVLLPPCFEFGGIIVHVVSDHRLGSGPLVVHLLAGLFDGTVGGYRESSPCGTDLGVHLQTSFQIQYLVFGPFGMDIRVVEGFDMLS